MKMAPGLNQSSLITFFASNPNSPASSEDGSVKKNAKGALHRRLRKRGRPKSSPAPVKVMGLVSSQPVPRGTSNRNSPSEGGETEGGRTRSPSVICLETPSSDSSFKAQEAWSTEDVDKQSNAFAKFLRFAKAENLSIGADRLNVKDDCSNRETEVYDESDEEEDIDESSEYVFSDAETEGAHNENKVSDRDGCWAIEKIMARRKALDLRVKKGTKETWYYYIKWSGWTHCYDSWEPERNLNRVSNIMKEFELREHLLSCIVKDPEYSARDENLRQLRNLTRWERDINKVLEGTRIPKIYVYNDRNANLRPERFTYILKNLLPEGMEASVNAPTKRVCDCSENACGSSERCCLARHRQGFFYTTMGTLRVGYSHESGKIIECCDQCACDMNCKTRVMQRGRRHKIAIVQTETCGWGVFALEDIPANRFIVEYVGEVMDAKVAKTKGNTLYQFEIGDETGDGKKYVIDARHYGNESAFINHSCNPNCVAIPVYVERGLQNYHRIGFFSAEDIKRGEELTLDYFNNPQEDYIRDTDGIKCNCGSENCKGFFPQLMFDDSPKKGEPKKQSFTPKQGKRKEVGDLLTLPESPKRPAVKRVNTGGDPTDF